MAWVGLGFRCGRAKKMRHLAAAASKVSSSACVCGFISGISGFLSINVLPINPILVKKNVGESCEEARLSVARQARPWSHHSNAEALKETKAKTATPSDQFVEELQDQLPLRSVELAIKSTYCWDIQLYPAAPRICSQQHILCLIYLFS